MKSPARNTLRLLRPHAGPYLGPLVLVVLLGAISAVGQKIVILLIQPVFEVLFPSEKSSLGAGTKPFYTAFQDLVLGPPDARAETDRIELLWRVVIAVAVIAIISSIAQYAFVLLSRWVSLRMVVSLRMQIARHLMGLSLRYHGQSHFGDLLSRVSADVGKTLDVVTRALGDLVQQPLQGLFSLVFAFVIAPVPTLVVLIGLPLLAVPFSILARKVRKGSTKSLTNLGASVQVLSQMFQGIRTVKAFSGVDRELERYAEINRVYVKSTMRMVRAMALSNAWTLAFSHIGLGLLLLVIGYLSLRTGSFESGGNMLAFFLLISQLQMSIKATTRVLMRAQESVGAAERLTELLEQTADVEERPLAHPIEELGTGLRFEDVTFTYPDSPDPAVSGLNLTLKPGETVALVGASGAGKSTVMDLVARFIDPGSGRVSVNGHDLRDLTIDSWTGLYAMVGQTPFLFHDTIEANIRYGKPDASRGEIEAAAAAAGIHDFICELPEGYETDVAEAGTRLSGGQRQRITIARAFLKGAPLLLLDEATSALDPETEARIQAALDRLMDDRTVLVIAHRLSTIRNADRIAVMDGGVLCELGTHEELLARGGGGGGVYARMHTAQHPLEPSN